MKKYLLSGLLVVIPITLTLYIFGIIVQKIDSLLLILPQTLHPDNYLPFHIPGLGIIFSIIFIISIGIFATNYIGKEIIKSGEKIVQKIPLIRGVYVAIKQLLEAMFMDKGKDLRKVILVEYPRNGIYVLGFVTGKFKENNGENLIKVFIPHTPNPTSGRLIIIREEDAILLDISAEETLKLIMSGGMISQNK